MLLDRFHYLFLWLFLEFDGDSKSDIVLYSKWLTGLQESNFLFMDRFEYYFSFFDLEIRLGFQIRNNTLPQMIHWTTKIQFLVYGPIWPIFFSLTWKYDRDSKSNIVLYLTGPQKFVIMILCKINFDIIWYSVIFAAIVNVRLIIWINRSLYIIYM